MPTKHVSLLRSSCKTGFVHNPISHKVYSHNDSGIFTLNGDPETIRGKRSTLTVFDESAFSSNELLTAAIAFSTQDSDFSTSIEKGYDIRTERLKTPLQLLFCSSMNDTECLFYKKFQDFSMRMMAGDRNYFTASIPCDVPLAPLMNGEPYPPLLKKENIESDMRTNKLRGLREYYNLPFFDNERQLIKRAAIIRNSTLMLPELYNVDNKSQYIVASDTARVGDNAIFGVMKLCHSESVGYYGEIVNCVNFLDTAKKKKMSIKIPDQMKMMRSLILDYNGRGYPDYENIKSFAMDMGSGGSPFGYTDPMLEDWTDEKGTKHKGFIDAEYELYKEEIRNYPNASNIMHLINPRKYRNQMCEELLELIEHDLIKFPREFDNKDYIVVEEEVFKKNPETGKMEKSMVENPETGKMEIETTLKNKQLTFDEKMALINIDIMKTETTRIQIIKDQSGNVTTYKSMSSSDNDDRFYVLLLLAHELYSIRRKNQLRQTKSSNYDFVFTYD